MIYSVDNYHVPHSITFGDKNTWDDWHIIPSERPSFAPPTLKSTYLSIPGASGDLDISESLTGYPVYNDREGSFTFYVMNGFQDWVKTYEDISNYLNGRVMKAYLEDDPNWYYEGRFQVSEWQSTVPWSTVGISYRVNPYKWSERYSDWSWLWDPFVFATDSTYVSPFDSIRINSSSSWVRKTFPASEFEYAPVCPQFIVSTTDNKGMDVRYYNQQLGINITDHFPNGTSENPGIVFYGPSNYELYFKGNGTVTIRFRKGRL